MQFLIMTKQATPPPPEMMLPLVGAMEAWVGAQRASGKLRMIWSLAGAPGGGGIVEVASPEELDEIMAGFPFGPFSSIDVYALSDLDRSLATLRTAFTQMMEMMAAKP